MLNTDVTLLVFSCDAYSDLWDGQVQQLEKHWPEHPPKAWIVTDQPTERQYEHIQVLVTPAELEWSERLAWVLQKVETPYVFFTLDDYFLIEDVPHDRINNYVRLMEQEGYDYIRLFKSRKKKTLDAHQVYHELRGIDLQHNYAINLYAGLWRTEFMRAAAQGKLNAWRFEVSLRKAGLAYGAKCLVCMDDMIYPFLDVVRKGKLLRKAAKYFHKHDIYHGDRAVNSWWYEFKLNGRAFVARHAPLWLFKLLKSIMHKFGHRFYSDEAWGK